MSTVCLITPGHLASTPRLVKEADALAESGYRVHIVAGQHHGPLAPLDQEMVSRGRWIYTAVSYGAGRRGLGRKLIRRFARFALANKSPVSLWLAARAVHTETLRLAGAAAKVDADLYIGHCLPALPAAALAAHKRNARFGFDIEDVHDAETDAASADRALRRATVYVQQKLLPMAAHVTASAPLISDRYREVYGVASTVVLNVFPTAEAPAEKTDPGAITEQNPTRFYWFSQTIGAGRGLERMITVLGKMKAPCELHLRGFISDDYRACLNAAAVNSGLRRPVHFLPFARPAEMVQLAATAHIGLSLEEPYPLNHDLCVANKVFAYLLAGVPQLLTPTSGQRQIAGELGTAAVLADTDEMETARRLDALLSDQEGYARARSTAWKLGRERFCWDIEKARFLASIERAIR